MGRRPAARGWAHHCEGPTYHEPQKSIVRCLEYGTRCPQLAESQAAFRRNEAAVARVFSESFPNESYSLWNSEVNDEVAKGIVASVGRAMTIRVDKFIDDLRNY